jgi:sugar lactone lactonase YvrE
MGRCLLVALIIGAFGCDNAAPEPQSEQAAGGASSYDWPNWRTPPANARRNTALDVLAGAADGGSDRVAARRSALARSSIAIENSKPGSSSWQLERPARAHEVEGYASAVSARAGDRVSLYVSVDQPKAVHYELFRMGYYQGLGGRFISSSPPQMVSPQAACAANSITGLVECDWEAAFEVEIDPGWVTGQYFFKLITPDGISSYIPLVVREPKRKAKVVVQSAVATWQAYNVFGGSSLYRNYLPKELGFKNQHADAVSFDRPYTCQDLQAADCRPGAGDFDFGERWLIQWLEQHDFEIAYVTNLDVDENGDPDLLRDRKLFIAVGHDEYWPLGERAALERARDAGVSLAFMSANTGYWRVRIEASTRGGSRRTVVCYKEAVRDVIPNAPETTTEYRLDPSPRPEQALLGIMYDDAASRTYFDGFAPVVTQQDHWIYEGTGVRNGDHLAHVIGYEWDRAFDAGAPPGREIVAHASLITVYGESVPHDISLYYPTEQSLVFAVGSIFWARGLSDPRSLDPRIVRMTENVLLRAGVAPFELTPVEARERDSSSHVEVVAGSGRSGTTDGPVASAQFVSPVGLAVDPDGTIYVTDMGAGSIRKISVNGEVTTLAGCGHNGFADGVGAAACFRLPSGIARAADGALIVADMGNNRIRRVSSNGSVTTIAGGRSGDNDSANPLEAQFKTPRGLAIDAGGKIYVAAQNLRAIDATGVSTAASVDQATGVAVAADGVVYVIATHGGVIQRYDGNTLTIAGTSRQFGDDDGDGYVGRVQLRPADGITVDGDSVVFTDSANHKLRAWRPDSGVVTLAGGEGSTLDLQMPRGVVSTPDGYLVADTGNHRIVRVRRP